MDRRRFLTVSLAGGAWFAGLWALSGKLFPPATPRRVRVEDYLRFGQRAALEAITPAEDFYITSKGLTPRVNLKQWRLAIDGLVEKPLTLTLDDVRSLPLLERVLTLECISNPVAGPWIGNANWRGAALRPLLEEARPRPEATHVMLHAADGLFTNHSKDRIIREENFLAYEMNGDPLPPDHGYPLRIFIPGKYGMKQPKWLTRIEFIPTDQPGYWERRGWSEAAERQTQSVIDTPREGAKLTEDTVLVAGWAVADASGIGQVEVSTDDGHSWQPAEIVSNPSPYVWAFWRYEWQPPSPGQYVLQARAVNGRGEPQPAQEADPGPEGATGYHRITVQVI